MTDVKDILGLSAQQQSTSSSSSSSSSMAPPPSHVFASPSPPLHPRMKRHSSTASPSPSASSLSSPHHSSSMHHRTSRTSRPSLLPQTSSASSSSSSLFSSSSLSSSAGKAAAPLAPSRLIIPSPSPAQHWVNVPIRSSARRSTTHLSHDDVDLLHWIKTPTQKTESGGADYRFARFNRSIKMRHYTDAQYDNHLIDPNWSRDETDVLMSLCQQYDLRFIVIADRYNSNTKLAGSAGSAVSETSEGTRRQRTVEELKGRYYGVQCKLLQLTNSSDPELRKHPLFTSSYDEEYEHQRKEQLMLLYNRRVKDVEGMSSAVLELRKVQQVLKRVKKIAREARDAQRVRSGGSGSGGGSSGEVSLVSGVGTGAGAGVGGTVSLSHKKKKKHSSSSASASSSSSASASALPLHIPDNQLAAIPDNLLPPPLLSTTTPQHPSLTQQTPFLRSQQFAFSLSTLPPKHQKSLTTDVTALGVPPIKELVPTAPVWEMWERVRVGCMQARALEALVEEREKVRDELREEERRKGGGSGHATTAAAGSGGEVKREKGSSSTSSGGSGGGGSSEVSGEEKRKDKKVKKERRESSMGSGDRDDGGGGGGSSSGGGGEKSEKTSVSHKKKDRDSSSKRKGGDGDDRDSKRRKK